MSDIHVSIDYQAQVVDSCLAYAKKPNKKKDPCVLKGHYEFQGNIFPFEATRSGIEKGLWNFQLKWFAPQVNGADKIPLIPAVSKKSFTRDLQNFVELSQVLRESVIESLFLNETDMDLLDTLVKTMTHWIVYSNDNDQGEMILRSLCQALFDENLLAFRPGTTATHYYIRIALHFSAYQSYFFAKDKDHLRSTDDAVLRLIGIDQMSRAFFTHFDSTANLLKKASFRSVPCELALKNVLADLVIDFFDSPLHKQNRTKQKDIYASVLYDSLLKASQEFRSNFRNIEGREEGIEEFFGMLFAVFEEFEKGLHTDLDQKRFDGSPKTLIESEALSEKIAEHKEVLAWAKKVQVSHLLEMDPDSAFQESLLRNFADTPSKVKILKVFLAHVKVKQGEFEQGSVDLEKLKTALQDLEKQYLGKEAKRTFVRDLNVLSDIFFEKKKDPNLPVLSQGKVKLIPNFYSLFVGYEAKRARGYLINDFRDLADDLDLPLNASERAHVPWPRNTAWAELGVIGVGVVTSLTGGILDEDHSIKLGISSSAFGLGMLAGDTICYVADSDCGEWLRWVLGGILMGATAGLLYGLDSSSGNPMMPSSDPSRMNQVNHYGY